VLRALTPYTAVQQHGDLGRCVPVEYACTCHCVSAYYWSIHFDLLSSTTLPSISSLSLVRIIKYYIFELVLGGTPVLIFVKLALYEPIQ
jgi:hypothetical protein